MVLTSGCTIMAHVVSESSGTTMRGLFLYDGLECCSTVAK